MRSLVHALLSLALLVATTVPALAVETESSASPNLLHNPSFEGGWYHASMSNFIAEGWSYWYQGRSADEKRSYWMPEPEFGIIAGRPGQTKSGNQSQRWFNTWAIHNAGVYQRVQVPQDAWLRFSIWMFNWSSEADVFGISDSPHHKWVGIDPTGGTDPFSPNIVWGNEDTTMDAWVQLGVLAQAQGDAVTVFVREQPEYSVKHNDVLIDDAELVVVPAPEEPVTQPVARADSVVAPEDIASPDQAVEISRLPRKSWLVGDASGRYAYFWLTYPGRQTPYKINLQVSPGDGSIVQDVGFRIYGPTRGRVYGESGAQPGTVPNVVGDLIADEPGRYLVQVQNLNPGVRVDYRIYVTGPGLVAEVPSSGT